MKRLIPALVLSLLFCFPALASTASASDWESNPVYGYIEELLKEVDYDAMDESEKLELLSLYVDTLSGPGVASSSDASLAGIESLLSDIHGVLVPQTEDPVDDLEDLPDDGVSLLALADTFNIDRNVVIYEGFWNGSEARLVLPAGTDGTLWVDGSGHLYNVGTSNIVGRIYYGDADLKDYNQYVFTLTPALSGNASTLYNDGYPNYCRRYYVSGGRVTYTTTYGDFTVTKVVNTPSDVPARLANLYLLVLIFIGGVIILCFWRRSQRL